MTYSVHIDKEPGRNLAVVQFSCPPEEIGERQGAAFGTVIGYLSSLGRHPAGPAVSRYTIHDGRCEIESGFVVSEPVKGNGTVVPAELPVVEVATTEHIGPYEDLPRAYDALIAGAAEQGRAVDEGAAMYEEYWTGPDTPEPRTVVCWPLLPA